MRRRELSDQLSRVGDPLQGEEDAAQPLSRFEVDRHPSKMIAREMDLIRELYQVLILWSLGFLGHLTSFLASLWPRGRIQGLFL